MVKLSFASGLSILCLSTALVTPGFAQTLSGAEIAANETNGAMLAALSYHQNNADLFSEMVNIQLGRGIGTYSDPAKKEADIHEMVTEIKAIMKSNFSMIKFQGKIAKDNQARLPEDFEVSFEKIVAPGVPIPDFKVTLRNMEEVNLALEAVKNYHQHEAELEAAVKVMEARLEEARRIGAPEADALQGQVDQQKAGLTVLRDGYNNIMHSVHTGDYSKFQVLSALTDANIAASVEKIMKPYNEAVMAIFTGAGSFSSDAHSLTAPEIQKEILNAQINPNDSHDRATDLTQSLINNFAGARTGTQAYSVTIDGRAMTLFVNYTTGNVVGYGYTGIGGSGVAPLGASGMDYAQGVFVGKLNANKTQIIGEFSGITGATAFDNKFHTVSVAGGDATSVRILDLPLGAYTNGGSGSIETNIAVGVGLGGITRTLSYTASQGASDPYKLGNGYNLSGASSGVPVTYEGYARILTQNRQSSTIDTPIVMDDLGDLKVTVNSAKGSEDVTFDFNGSNPQATATKAVVNDRIAGAVSHLTDNVLRTGVMFPLENYNDVNLVHFMDYSEGLSNAIPNGVGYGFGIVGKPTQVADLPAGTATYTGGAAGYVTKEAWVPGQITDLQQFYGNTTMNVNFGTNAVTGTINTFQQSNNAAIDSFNITGNVVSNGVDFTLTNAGAGTGAGKGTFFGPAGNEIGGQFNAVDGTTTHDGVFWGAR